MSPFDFFGQGLSDDALSALRKTRQVAARRNRNSCPLVHTAECLQLALIRQKPSLKANRLFAVFLTNGGNLAGPKGFELLCLTRPSVAGPRGPAPAQRLLRRPAIISAY